MNYRRPPASDPSGTGFWTRRIESLLHDRFSDDAQAVIWLLRKDSIGRNGMLCTDAKPVELRIGVPGLSTGCYSVTGWKTREGRVCAVFEVKKESGPCLQVPPFITDLALTLGGQ